MKKYTHIIWDFNGTILNDVQIGINSINQLLEKRGLAKISSVEQYRSVFGFPIIEYYKRIGFDFDAESYDDVAVEWVDLYNSARSQAPVYQGAVKLMKRFKECGIKQLVLSATERNMLASQIEELGILEYFNEIVGIDDIKAGGKTHAAIEWRKRNENACPLFIGDTDHDVETARAMGAECVLVADGHQGYDYLSTLGVSVYHNMDELYCALFDDMPSQNII